MRVIAFETSCDETSVAVVETGFKVLSDITTTQKEHKRYGGVVPELASRIHTKLIVPHTESALKRANLTLGDIDAVAFTYGPGLLGALLVGVVFAKTIAQVMSKPFIGINHLEGHLFSVFLNNPHLSPPILYLIASGGHTELVLMKDYFSYEVLGETLDDAAGEAFDKGAKLLGLGYPGGPEIDRLAKKGDREFVRFPRAKVKNLNFSFSGLKTALLYYVRDNDPNFLEEHKNDISASYQEAIVDMLLEKIERALDKKGASTLAIVGGVALNSRLREKTNKKLKGIRIYYPDPAYCTDNAAMIGAAGILRLEKNQRSELDITATPHLRL